MIIPSGLMIREGIEKYSVQVEAPCDLTSFFFLNTYN